VLSKPEFLAYQASFVGYWAGDFQLTVGLVVCEGAMVCVQMESRATLKSGKVYQQQYHQFFEVAGSRIVTYKTYFDTHHFVQCFSGGEAILGQPERSTNLFDHSLDVRVQSVGSEWQGKLNRAIDRLEG
jgi:hypothetical protein